MQGRVDKFEQKTRFEVSFHSIISNNYEWDVAIQRDIGSSELLTLDFNWTTNRFKGR